MNRTGGYGERGHILLIGQLKTPMTEEEGRHYRSLLIHPYNHIISHLSTQFHLLL